MKRKLLFVTMLTIAVTITAFSQTPVILTVSQPEPLQAIAGEDAQIASGESTTIGGDPSAKYGYEGYIYFWAPAEGLDDPTLPNPVASPGETVTYLLTVYDANNCSATDEVTITVGTSGMEDLYSPLEMKCYPNPVSQDLTLEFEGTFKDLRIKLINPLGKELITIDLPPANSILRKQISMSNLPDGIYFIKAVSDKKTIVKSIIKTR